MSHDVFVVQFEDGLRMYGVNDGAACHNHPFLFDNRDEAEAWIFSGNRDTREIPKSPVNASLTEENVIIEPDETWSFPSLASRSEKWITGPLESTQGQDSWDDHPIYGGGYPAE